MGLGFQLLLPPHHRKIVLQKEQRWNKTAKYMENKNVSSTTRAVRKLLELLLCLLVYIYNYIYSYINISHSSVSSALKF